MTLRSADPSDNSNSATTPLAGILGDLSRMLWEQRELIELLEYRLEVQQLLTIAGRADRLPLAIADLEVLQLVASTEELAATNRELAAKGIADSRRAFEHIGDVPVTAYGRHGSRPGLALPPTLVDRDA